MTEYTPEQLRELIEALRNGAPLPSDEAIALATAHASALEKLKVAEEALVECQEEEARTRFGLASLLDQMVIHSENIGRVRRALFLPIDCAWNSLVLDMTAERENQPPRHLDDVQRDIDAARGK